MRSTKNDLVVAAAIAASVFIFFYAASPPASFLQWDDAANLLNNDKWRGLSWSHLSWMWSTRHYGPWQPLSWLSWAVDLKLWGLSAEAFRRTNITFHAITAALFFLACRRLLPRESTTPLPFGAAGAALFFALHPLRVESVVWITERRDVLSGFFVVLALLAWLEDRRVVSAFAFAGAVLSKGTSICFIPFIFAVEVFMRGRDARKAAIGLLPHAVIGIFAASMNLRGFQTGDLHGMSFGAVDRMLISLSGSWFYLSKTFLPFDLSPYYELPLNGVRQGSYPGTLLALLVTGLCFHKKVRAWAVPVWFAYLLALAPVSGLLQNGRQAAADRYSYLACMPFALLFGLALGALEVRRPRTAAGVLTATAIFLASATAVQAQIWRNDITLWTRAVGIMPTSYLPNANLSVALLVAHRDDDAIPYLKKAIDLEPKDAESRVNLASILAHKGDDRSAIRLFSEAVALRANDPSFASARYNLGLLLIRQGRKSDGLAQMREAVRLDPSLGRSRR